MMQRVFRAGVGPLGTCLVSVVFALSLFAFISDLWRVNTLAYGLFYTPLVSTALFLRARRGAWLLAAVGSGFVAIGAFFPVIAPDLPDLVGNRILSVVAIFATAFFVHRARFMQERLAAQTRRAEAAERIKSELLANLSHEIRSPLHGLLGISQLMMLEGRPDHRHALTRIRSGVRQLLTNVENLIDLTSLDERPTKAEPLDACAVVRDAMEQAECVAAERQVTLRGPADGAGPVVHADRWALRRIVESLLLHAIAQSPAGGTVSLGVQHKKGAVTVSVSDPGSGVARELREDTVSPAMGTDLALSVRLARRMGGKLAAGEQASGGLVLRLPAADAGPG